jgi:hypothetical protein
MKKEKVLDQKLKLLEKVGVVEEVEDPYKNNFNLNVIPLAHISSKDAKKALRTFGQLSLVPVASTKKSGSENQDED